jgi:hypothetical protein
VQSYAAKADGHRVRVRARATARVRARVRVRVRVRVRDTNPNPYPNPNPNPNPNQAYGHSEGFGRLQGALVLAQYVGGFGGVALTALLRERTRSYLAPFALFPVLALAMCAHCYAVSWGGSRGSSGSGGVAVVR